MPIRKETIFRPQGVGWARRLLIAWWYHVCRNKPRTRIEILAFFRPLGNIMDAFQSLSDKNRMVLFKVVLQHYKLR